MMKTRTLLILLCVLSISSAASALSSSSCDAYSIALDGNPVMTAVSGTGNTVAIGGTNGMIGIFTPEGSPRWMYQISDPVTGIAISDDGRFMVATTYNGDLLYFDNKGNLLWNLSGFGCNSHVALSGDGQEGYVFSRSPTNDLTGDTIFHVTGNGSVLSRMPVPVATSYDLSADGRIAVVNSGGTQGYNSIVAIDDAGIRWEKISPHQWRVPLVAVSDDCSTVAAAEPGFLAAFSCSGRMLWNTTPKYMAKAVAVSGDGEHIVVGTQYQVLYFNRSGALVWDYSVPDYVGHVKTSQNGSKIAATTRQTLYYLDGNGTSLWQYPLKDWTGNLALSDAGDLIVAGMFNDTFTILNGSGNATEIDLNTIPAQPVVTVKPQLPVNSSVVPTRSQSAPVFPFLAGIALGCVILYLRVRGSRRIPD